MDLDTLNEYLQKLHGNGYIVSMVPEAEILTMKFCGSVGGPYDDGEIELTFTGIDVVHLPLSMILPVQIHQADGSETDLLLRDNYRWDDRTLWILTDGVDARWHVYAGRYSVSVLPALWRRP